MSVQRKMKVIFPNSSKICIQVWIEFIGKRHELDCINKPKNSNLEREINSSYEEAIKNIDPLTD